MREALEATIHKACVSQVRKANQTSSGALFHGHLYFSVKLLFLCKCTSVHMISFVFILTLFRTVTNSFATTLYFEFFVMVTTLTSFFFRRSKKPFLYFTDSLSNEILIFFNIDLFDFQFIFLFVWWIKLDKFAKSSNVIRGMLWSTFRFYMPMDIFDCESFGAFPNPQFSINNLLILFDLTDEVLNT